MFSIKNELFKIIDNVLAVGSDDVLLKIYDEVGVVMPLDSAEKKPLNELSATDDGHEREIIGGYLYNLVVEKYNQLERQLELLEVPDGSLPAMRQIERQLYLSALDNLWIEHLETMNYLRTGIGLRGYGQRDPLVEYKSESLRLFRGLLELIDRQVAYSVFKIGFVSPQEMKLEERPEVILQGASEQSAFSGDAGLKERNADKIIKDASHYNGIKVGRNDPCPCGSVYPDGNRKKFKDCCGR